VERAERAVFDGKIREIFHKLVPGGRCIKDRTGLKGIVLEIGAVRFQGG
jgi:hypothetical protein